MQPYFMPYLGYFQLIGAVDVFVLYDNIKYTKKGWINRNRFLLNSADTVFSLPLKKASDFSDVVERELAENFSRDRLLSQLRGAYYRAPYFEDTWPLLERIVRYADGNLFRFIYHSIVCICQHLGIRSEIRISSEIAIDHDLKGSAKIVAFCQALGANTYINAIGGMSLYSKELFLASAVDLKFIATKPFEYAQFDGVFVPWLSIVDVLMFNTLDVVREIINHEYELI